MAECEAGPVPRRLYPRDAVIRFGGPAEGLDASDLTSQTPTPRVLRVSYFRALSPAEELALGRVVRLHSAVQVEVIPGQVGEERPLETRPRDATKLYAVRGDFHDDPPDTRLQHPGE